jgi:hypothetical protein
MSSLETCKLIDLPRVDDPRGHLTFIEGTRHVPFEIARVYYVYGTPEGAERGGHAHRRLEQLIIAPTGSFEVILDDATSRMTVRLTRPDQGLYIGSMVWRELARFTAGAVCLVLASAPYDEADYYRDYQEFVQAVRGVR